MKLLPVYARACGVTPILPEDNSTYYPLSQEPYVIFQNSSGQESKQFSYFNEILQIIGPLLIKNGVKIYQIGAKDEIPLKFCEHLMGKTSLKQAFYVIKNAKLLISNDSFSVHQAGMYGVPILALYGSTGSDPHGPYFCNPDKTVLIESHRNGNQPTFSQESPKSVDKIPPEQVINAALKLLGANIQIDRQSLFIGQIYSQQILEYVPNFGVDPNFLKDTPLTARVDYLDTCDDSNWQALAHCASHRKVAIVSDKPIPLGLLFQFKQNIANVAFEIGESFTIEYVKDVKKIGLKVNFYSYETDSQLLSDLRLKFFDYSIIEKKVRRTREDFLAQMANYQNKEIDKDWKVEEDTWYKSNKFILSGSKIYLSRFALKNNLPTESFDHNTQTLIDDPLTWEELDFYYYFRQKLWVERLNLECGAFLTKNG